MLLKSISGGSTVSFTEEPSPLFVITPNKNYRVWCEGSRPYIRDDTGYRKPLEVIPPENHSKIKVENLP